MHEHKDYTFYKLPYISSKKRKAEIWPKIQLKSYFFIILSVKQTHFRTEVHHFHHIEEAKKYPEQINKL